MGESIRAVPNTTAATMYARLLFKLVWLLLDLGFIAPFKSTF